MEKGYGVFRDGKEQTEQNVPGPNFAGRYIIVQWGCGVPCVMAAVVDASTGIIYPPPMCWGRCGTESLALPLLQLGFSAGIVGDFDFRLNSRLLIMQATPDTKRMPSPSYAYYYLWEENQWRLLRRVRLKEDPL